MTPKHIKKAESPHSSKRMNNNMKQTNKTIAATSPAAMGKALVLLATSCAALSSGPSIPAGRRGVASQQRSAAQHSGTVGGRFQQLNNDGARATHSMVALHYRDGDEDQPLDMQAANQGAVASASNSAAEMATPTSHAVSRTHFNLFMFPITRRLMMPSMPAMPSMPQEASKEDEQQLVMDEYLEYVERRYSRMHPKHRPQQPKGSSRASRVNMRPRVVLDFDLPRKIFLTTLALHRVPSPLASLGQRIRQPPVVPSPKPKQPTVSDAYDRAAAATARQQASDTRDQEEEDPLNVLGLSSLASARLRQRLHVPRDLRDEYMQLTSSRASAVNFINHYMHLSDHTPKTTSPTSTAVTGASTNTQDNEVAAEGGRTSSYISLSFTVQFQLLLATLHRIALAFAHTIKIMTAFGSRMFSEILDKGGFRHSLRMMSVTSVAILFMFKPLFRGALKQG
eukprot:CAMPEP_0172316562 /NCGR_PEP_ID=MMETSP1058-20130122/28673_1 /TAXON_ID=83371 /ORGANISM="Detonula confervacea, Strain CCMP 353" /LENGTH=452 /DNA_ID=CAMNT_0013030901 /DNA_START=74 /DNA_END=1432 /DNA_ORIENTATION=+